MKLENKIVKYNEIVSESINQKDGEKDLPKACYYLMKIRKLEIENKVPSGTYNLIADSGDEAVLGTIRKYVDKFVEDLDLAYQRKDSNTQFEPEHDD